MHSLNNFLFKRDKPWLILGKGPSFSRRNEIDFDKYYTFGLNETVNFIECSIGHFIDIEVSWRLRKSNKHTVFIVPFHPHYVFKPSVTITSELKNNTFLRQLNYEDRLFTYNLSTYKGHILHKNAPYIKARYFSVEAAFRILANAGIREIFTLGIDGGTKYAEEFDGLKPLSNGQPSFDKQFIELDKILRSHSMEWKVL